MSLRPNQLKRHFLCEHFVSRLVKAMFEYSSLLVLFLSAVLLVPPGALSLVLSSSSLIACVQDGSQVRAHIR